ncbi:dUTP diphosphatase [Paenibacillus gallinarum]|uniref:dUTP diphosphatase n=1 Tax=Paenibacillus gallinarum TaxID=2762232 RepID=A0ABR8SWL9_9BACL|nr:dUTP diphosphatase [Paenibacillus gallinarum]MBD7967729.1 dUTP diphosphatase [Paenibacillus gallinarum]
MNISKLFEMQRVLDERIVKEKGLEGQDMLPQKILALQVELGECANEWRGFKFWSVEWEPRTSKHTECKKCYEGYVITKDTRKKLTISNEKCPHCMGKGYRKSNPLLEEYIDCLHFILSIGISLDYLDSVPALNRNIYTFKYETVTKQFTKIFALVGKFGCWEQLGSNYLRIVMLFGGLGEMLGFTWEQIEEAYLAKNQVNHERQSTGY